MKLHLRTYLILKMRSNLPVPYKVLELLEGNLARVFQSQSAILCEVVEMLEVVLLDVIEEVVDQDGAGHQRQSEDGGAISHCAVLVEGSLSVNQSYSHLSS